MSFTRWSPLLGTLVRLDDTGTSPPWPLEVYNPDTHAWEAVGIVGAQGPAGPAGSRAISGLLSLLPSQSGVLDANYLARMDGLAILTGNGDPIATTWPRVVTQEQLVLTSAGEVIVV